VAERALEWLRHVEARVGRRPLLYTNPTFWRDYLAADHPLTDYPLWLAEYASEAPPEAQYGWSGWQFWQFSQRGKRPGVPLPVDLNLYHGTHDELRSALTRRP
jgi:lysozyme